MGVGQDGALDCAIIGGGMSGMYSAWRLATAPDSIVPATGVHLFEMSDRIGGRLDTIRLPGMPHVPVELGGMRIMKSQSIIWALIHRLGFTPIPFPMGDSHNLAYLRGKRFEVGQYADPSLAPYALTGAERGKSPSQLVVHGIEAIIPGASTMTYAQLRAACAAATLNNCAGWALNDLALDPPTQIHLSLDTGPLGFGVCAVIGGKLGAPDRTCLAIAGDGAFLMHGSELSTAVRYNIGAVWIIMENNDLAMVSQGNAHYFPATPPEPSWTDYYRLGNPDLAIFAASLGADTWRARDPAGLRAALSKAILQADSRRRPQVIVLEIDRAEAPPFYRARPRAGGATPSENTFAEGAPNG